MTLRARLVAALLVLLALGMLVYGVGTYQAFASAERARLDEELVQALPLVRRSLLQGIPPMPGGRDPGGGRGQGGAAGPAGPDGGPRFVQPGTFAAVYGPDGGEIASGTFGDGDRAPDLTGIDLGDAAGREDQQAGADGRTLLTVPGTSAGASWRVVLDPLPEGAGTLVVAVPTSSVDRALSRLVAIELVAGVALLGALAAGAWAVLRRGLRPLEQMAAAASTVTAGNLHHRVPVPAGGGEVATLGHAVNGMLDELEGAFAERAAAEARLRRFVADASHELRTPLTSIQGYAELFRLGRARTAAPPAADERPADDAGPAVDEAVVARRIEEEAGRMRRLVEDLLTLARLDEVREPVRAPVDLAVVAADACSDAIALAPDRRVTLDAPAPVVVLGDEAHLRQAVTNLVANAVRHTPDGTPIDLATHVVGDRATLVVRDHGPGLDPTARERVFDRFWQADAARSGTGTGLGLSIVRAVAAEHGGEVSAANHPDGGATFALRLPVAPAGTPAGMGGQIPPDEIPPDEIPPDEIPPGRTPTEDDADRAR